MRWRLLIWVLLESTLVVIWCWSIHKGTLLGPTQPSSGRRALQAHGLDSQSALAQSENRQHRADLSLSRSRFQYRLSNTSKQLDELMRNPQAILLENALLDTSAPLDLPIPANLRAQGEPGSYIVQCRRELNDSFRQSLSRVGARIVAYIPNNAYLVRMEGAAAGILEADPEAGTVLPYEPYYKIKASLLTGMLDSHSDPTEPITINALLFDQDAQSVLPRLAEAGITGLTQSHSSFGTLVRIRCPRSLLVWIAQLPGVQEMEPAHARVAACDLTRARLGVAADTVTGVNYLGLDGSNVLVNVNDLGVDSNHPDLSGRVFWDVVSSGVDHDGHGTHVAGIIAGSGGQSLTVTNAPGSFMPPVPLQFRGLAPAARILSVAVGSEARTANGDAYLQETAATNRAFISNNSWHYLDDTDYDLGAADFDAAVRDALPTVPGSQPLLCVFAAGNAGRGSIDGSGGMPDTIQSPGTAKNVITVGAIEAPRFLTNQTWTCTTNGTVVTCQTNAPWLTLTDSSNQVASFSSRGNVGLGIEGPPGRLKPDLVAPGDFIISARSTTWDQASYYSASTNVLGSPFTTDSAQVLSNLNNGLGPFYRFESGTSLAAAAVSGTLALMEQFFETHFSRTPSPALMKAMLINGARSLGAGYNLGSSSATNSQGWGVVQLPNSLPSVLTNGSASDSSMWLFDQAPLEALATGQQRTRFVRVASEAQNLPFRVTLAWTDPPGNPVAGLKLVNDLDLIVTNLQTGEVFWGNDIPAGANFNAVRQPGSPPNRDLVNNVENVYLAPALGSNYSITVLARRVGVNAVNEHPNGVVQDYALVLSSGDGQLTNALSVSDVPTVVADRPIVTTLTNSFASGGADFGSLVLHQRAGANAPLLGTNFIVSPLSSNEVINLGTPEQWHFYVFTNGTSFTNAVFLTFSAQALGMMPGAGFVSAVPGSSQPWSAAADVDLYVSQDAGLTNLDPVVLAAADRSLGRDGAEAIIYSNAAPGTYYLGVKCESPQGADYGLLADVSRDPFAQADLLGNEILRGFPVPTTTSIGEAGGFGQSYSFFVSPDSIPLRRVIVTNILSYASPTDLETTLSHNAISVTLHRYSTNGASAAGQTFVYDDSQEGDVPGALPSDGPGSLRQFSGQNGGGQWLLNTQTTNQPGTNQGTWIFLERQPDLSGNIVASILPGVCREDFFTVPRQATNATVVANLVGGMGAISLQVYPARASASNYVKLVIDGTSPAGALTVDQFSQPPLNPGLYVVRTCNLGQEPANVTIQSSTVAGPQELPPYLYSSAAPSIIADDALSFSILDVTNTAPILSVEVGVRINHPRISDLILSLVGPDGTRVLLAAERGGTSSNGMGVDLVVTNTTPVSFSGGAQAVTNVFETGEPAGTIVIGYDFFALPDDLRVYYEDKLLYDSGLISFGGGTNVHYGPGNSTAFTVVMNQGGNSESNTAWFYSITSTRIEPGYLTFTENTNLANEPLKFVAAPFTNLTGVPADPSAGTGLFCLPEEPLSRFTGKNAFGPWRLEVLDLRAGATSPPPSLVSWQLSLALADTVPSPIQLSPAGSTTNLLGAGQIQWFEVDVPDWISFATNSLLSASGPVNLFVNANRPPTGTNAGDIALGFGSTNGNWVLRTNAVPGLTPGSGYFLGLLNTNPSTVTIAFAVDFDVGKLVTLDSGIAYANTNFGPLNSADYYRFVVSTNAVRAQFEVNAPGSDVTLLARRGPPLPNLGRYDFRSTNPGTNDELIEVYDFSAPVSLSAGEWFLAVVNVTGSPAAYSILATEFPAYGTNILLSEPVASTNALCLTWNSLPGIHYFVQGRATLQEGAWVNLSSTLTASDNTTSFCLPLPSPFQYFRVLEGLALVPALPIIGSVSASASGTTLQWSAPTNQVFGVQWTGSLISANWQSVPGSVTSTNGTFLFFDDGSRTGGLASPRFYRLRQLP